MNLTVLTNLNFKSVTDKLQGRTTTFVVFFALIGTIFQWLHRLDMTYIAFMTALMGFVVGHSYKEDKVEAIKNGP